jgi:hypothetical protein
MLSYRGPEWTRPHPNTARGSTPPQRFPPYECGWRRNGDGCMASDSAWFCMLYERVFTFGMLQRSGTIRGDMCLVCSVACVHRCQRQRTRLIIIAGRPRNCSRPITTSPSPADRAGRSHEDQLRSPTLSSRRDADRGTVSRQVEHRPTDIQHRPLMLLLHSADDDEPSRRPTCLIISL